VVLSLLKSKNGHCTHFCRDPFLFIYAHRAPLKGEALTGIKKKSHLAFFGEKDTHEELREGYMTM